jgi:hypothetical protein
VYSSSEAEVLDWTADKAMRRYEIAVARLGLKKE